MTSKITVMPEDDLDGGPAYETVRFGIDSADYEIDLNKRHASAFRRKFAPFIEHTRKASKGQRHRPDRTAASRDRSGGIRAWAKAQGIAVSERRRIPASIVEQYSSGDGGGSALASGLRG